MNLNSEGFSFWLYCRDCVAIVGVTVRMRNKRFVLRPNQCAHPPNGLVVMEDRKVIPLRKER